jgi:hypothetical protein
MDSNDGAEKKYAVFHAAYDPETDLALIEVVIGPRGAGAMATSFLQDRDPAASDREANAALLRQAAEMLLERAGMMLRPPSGRPSR